VFDSVFLELFCVIIGLVQANNRCNTHFFKNRNIILGRECPILLILMIINLFYILLLDLWVYRKVH
jgi:hypothetical protein